MTTDCITQSLYENGFKNPANASNFDKMADNEYSASEFHLKNALIYKDMTWWILQQHLTSWRFHKQSNTSPFYFEGISICGGGRV